jgi:hypothetical protein
VPYTIRVCYDQAPRHLRRAAIPSGALGCRPPALFAAPPRSRALRPLPAYPILSGASRQPRSFMEGGEEVCGEGRGR